MKVTVCELRLRESFVCQILCVGSWDGGKSVTAPEGWIWLGIQALGEFPPRRALVPASDSWGINTRLTRLCVHSVRNVREQFWGRRLGNGERLGWGWGWGNTDLSRMVRPLSLHCSVELSPLREVTRITSGEEEGTCPLTSAAAVDKTLFFFDSSQKGLDFSCGQGATKVIVGFVFFKYTYLGFSRLPHPLPLDIHTFRKPPR